MMSALTAPRPTPAELKALLMQRFETNRCILQQKLDQRQPRQRPLVTVVLSHFDDQSMIRTKMLARSLAALLQQAL